MSIADGSRVDPAFLPLLRHLDAAVLERETGSVYGMWPDSRIAYVNDGYVAFAREEGFDLLGAGGGLGARVLDTVPEPLLPFYARLFARALTSAEPLTHRYDCHSPTLERKYDLRLYSLGGEGLLAVHALVLSRPHGALAPPDAPRYRDAHGTITQCCHCRRVRRVDDAVRWDLVAEYIAESPAGTSHGLCELCFAYHYP